MNNKKINTYKKLLINVSVKNVIIALCIIAAGFQLFKDEITDAYQYLRPKEVVEQHGEKNTCSRKVYNSNYSSEKNSINQKIEESCDTEYPFPKNRWTYFNTIDADLAENEKIRANRSACYKDRKSKAIYPPEYLDKSYECTKTVTEKWFYIFGKKWKKIE